MKFLVDSIVEKFEVHSYHNALEVLANSFPNEWKDISDTLLAFKISIADLSASGGSETNIPGKIDSVLYPRKWRNVQVVAELNIKMYERIVDQKQYEEFPSRESVIPDYLNGQQIDYLKGRVAVYLEWNKKDIAFDKTLNDIRQLYECGVIDVAVLITRSQDLNEAFKQIMDSDGKPIWRKYGSSSTWLGRLLPRLTSRQAGGCPVLVFGIKKKCIEGYDE